MPSISRFSFTANSIFNDFNDFKDVAEHIHTLEVH